VEKLNMQRFNLQKLKDVAIIEQYQVEISKRFSAFENLDGDDVDLCRYCESIRENLKASATESKLL
jgi:hypothetical protein